MRRGRKATATCSGDGCGVVFERVARDLVRFKRVFCSGRCRDLAAATGRTYVDTVCDGCGGPCRKLASEWKRYARHYCTPACYQASVDRAALGRAGAAVAKAVDPEKARERSRKGGLARARNLTPEQLREIAMAGVRARLDPARRSEVTRKAVMNRRFGKLSVLGVRLGLKRGEA